MSQCVVCKGEMAVSNHDLKVPIEVCEKHYNILKEAEKKNDHYFKVRGRVRSYTQSGSCPKHDK